MQIKKISMFMLCLFATLPIVASLGYLPGVPGFEGSDISETDVYQQTGLQDLADSSAIANADASDDTVGFTSIISYMFSIKTLIGVVFFVFNLGVALGFPPIVAGAVQSIIYIMVVWTLIQLWTGRNVNNVG